MERLKRYLKSQSAGSEAAMPFIPDSEFAHVAAGDGLPIPSLADMASDALSLAGQSAPAPAETINESTGTSQAEMTEPAQGRRAPTASLTTPTSHRIPLPANGLLSRLDGVGAYQPINPAYLDGMMQGVLNTGQWLRLHGQLDDHLAANMEDSGGFFEQRNITTALLTPSVMYRKDAGTPPAATAHRDNATSAGGLKEGMTSPPW